MKAWPKLIHLSHLFWFKEVYGGHGIPAVLSLKTIATTGRKDPGISLEAKQIEPHTNTGKTLGYLHKM